MLNICFYFQIHQPDRLRRLSVFDVGNGGPYFDDEKNREILERVAAKCYRPMTRLLLDEIERTQGAFRVAFSVSGTALEQIERWAPDVLKQLRALAETGAVEFLAETYYHSLSAIFDREEFDAQVDAHVDAVGTLLGVTPRVFRNTELILRDDIAQAAEDRGMLAVLGEGADRLLGWRSPHYLYRARTEHGLPLLLKSYQLSDDIAFRFGNKEWQGFPLTAETYASWLASVHGDGELVNLFMDFETFGEHQWADTGIFEFMRALPAEVLRRDDQGFLTPSEAAEQLEAVGEVAISDYVSWADIDRDLSAWLENRMQRAATDALYNALRQARKRGDDEALGVLRRFSTSDHVYYMCTKWFQDGDVHKYFSPYESPFDAYMAFMNGVNDIMRRGPRAPRSWQLQEGVA